MIHLYVYIYMQSTVKSQINLDVDGSGKKWLLKKTSGWCIDRSHQVYLYLCVLVRLLLKQRIHAKSVFIAQAIGVGNNKTFSNKRCVERKSPSTYKLPNKWNNMKKSCTTDV